MTTDSPAAERIDDGELCDRCGSLGEDRRTLRMDCFYAMNELDIPFRRDLVFRSLEPDGTDCFERVKEPTAIEVPGSDGMPPAHIAIDSGEVRCSGRLAPESQYTLRVCKRCRGEWMAAIQKWYRDPPQGEDHDAAERPAGGCGSGIFVRDNGAIKEITRAEWDRRVVEKDRIKDM